MKVKVMTSDTKEQFELPKINEWITTKDKKDFLE